MKSEDIILKTSNISNDSHTIFLVIFVSICCVAIIFYFCVITPFLETRRYIKLEIGRSDGYERMHWKHELKRLYISLIPFIGPALIKKYYERKRKK